MTANQFRIQASADDYIRATKHAECLAAKASANPTGRNIELCNIYAKYVQSVREHADIMAWTGGRLSVYPTENPDRSSAQYHRQFGII